MPPLRKRVIDAAPPWARPGVELTVRTVADAVDDRLPGLAAEVAFFAVLSLPPLLLTFVGTAGYLGGAVATEVERTLLDAARTVFSPTTMTDHIRPMIRTLLEDGRPDIASLGFVLAVWSASRALNATIEAVTIAYDLSPQRRSGIVQRLASYGFTILALLAGAVLMVAMVIGPRVGARLAQPLGLSGAVEFIWRLAYWPIIGMIAVGFITLLYHLGTPAWTPWRRDLPGAVLAVAGWVLGSVALRYYANVSIRGGDEAVYRRFAAPLVLLLWVYVTSFVLLLGAELNAEIEKLWPTAGQQPDHDQTLPRRLQQAARNVRNRIGHARTATVLPGGADEVSEPARPPGDAAARPGAGSGAEETRGSDPPGT